MKTRAKPGEARAFIKHASEYTGDACLLWPFGCNSAGYGSGDGYGYGDGDGSGDGDGYGSINNSQRIRRPAVTQAKEGR